MSAISSTTSGSLASLLAQLASQNQAAATPVDALLANETDSEGESAGGTVPQSNIFAAIAALGPFNSVTQQGSGTQDSLAAFLGALEQNDPAALGTDSAAGTAANSSASLGDSLNAIAASNDTSSQQAAISQLLSADGLTPSQLQMDFLTATLQSSNLNNESSASDLMFPELAQNSTTQSPLSLLG